MCWIDCILTFIFDQCGCLGAEMADEVPKGMSVSIIYNIDHINESFEHTYLLILFIFAISCYF